MGVDSPITNSKPGLEPVNLVLASKLMLASKFCCTPGCVLRDFHDGPHSFECNLTKRSAAQFDKFVDAKICKAKKETDVLAAADAFVTSRSLNSLDFTPLSSVSELTEPVQLIKPAQSTSPILSVLNDDAYDSLAKKVTRYHFAQLCVEAARNTQKRDILYLESEAGGATKELLKYFEPSQLFPCNKSAEAVSALAAKFPGVIAIQGNIYKVYKRQKWLGVWFDTEETWQHNHTAGQPWRLDQIPIFDRAHVSAVTLTTGTGPNPVKGGAETLATELAQLIEDKGGKMTILPVPYDGKGGRMNMVFGLGTFECDPEWTIRDYNYARLHIPIKALGRFDGQELYMVRDNHYIATAIVKGDQIFAAYMSQDGNFFSNSEDDPFNEISVEQAKKWLVI